MKPATGQKSGMVLVRIPGHRKPVRVRWKRAKGDIVTLRGGGQTHLLPVRQAKRLIVG